MLNEVLWLIVEDEMNGLDVPIHKYTDWNFHVTHSGNNKRPRFAEAIAIMLQTIYEEYTLVFPKYNCHIDNKRGGCERISKERSGSAGECWCSNI